MSRNLVLLWKHSKKKYELAKNSYGNLTALITSDEYICNGPADYQPKSYCTIYNQLRNGGQYEDDCCIIKRCEVVKSKHGEK